VVRPPHRLLPALWHGRSIRGQLLLAFVLIDLVAVLVAGSVAIIRARSQIRAEMASSMRLAEFLVGDAAKFVDRQLPAQQFLAELPEQLRSLRHVRVEITNTVGAVMAPRSRVRPTVEHEPAPAWFSWLVVTPIKPDIVPVTVSGQQIGQVEIIGQPADETAEVWGDLVAIGGVALALNIAMIAILYFLFGRVLDPLAVLTTGLSDLEHHSYGVRLPQSNTPELAVIANQFNALAGALEAARSENQQLNRRLITAQDDERRRTAMELHDEVGPCLFGLKAYGSSIASMTSAIPGKMGESLSECSGEILSITEHLQSINRSMLDRLRPMALGHVPLTELLRDLVHARSRQHPQISFNYKAGTLARSYGDSIDLTIYRCIQESLTNAIRHARAKQVSVELRQDDGLLELTARDDGHGLSTDTPTGFGIRGMRERVEALGGQHQIASEPGQGTRIRIFIPVADTPCVAAEVDKTSGVRT
jgi:two-component system, NarL family, sensor histidine kinase UhpB